MVIVIIFYLRYVHAISNVVVVASAVELVVAPVVVGCSWRFSIICGLSGLSVITNVDF